MHKFKYYFSHIEKFVLTKTKYTCSQASVTTSIEVPGYDLNRQCHLFFSRATITESIHIWKSFSRKINYDDLFPIFLFLEKGWSNSRCKLVKWRKWRRRQSDHGNNLHQVSNMEKKILESCCFIMKRNYSQKCVNGIRTKNIFPVFPRNYL